MKKLKYKLKHNLRVIRNLKSWCWHCDMLQNEWFGIKGLISRKGKCFYCRIDALDEKYGPSLCAELNKKSNGKYESPVPNRREIAKLSSLLF